MGLFIKSQIIRLSIIGQKKPPEGG